MKIIHESIAIKKDIIIAEDDILYNVPGTDDDVIVVKKVTDKKYDIIKESDDQSNIETIKKNPKKAWEDVLNDKCHRCLNKNCAAVKNKEDPTDIVGAHVWKNRRTKDIAPGEKCYIIPICRSCNSSGTQLKIQLKKPINAIEIKW